MKNLILARKYYQTKDLFNVTCSYALSRSLPLCRNSMAEAILRSFEYKVSFMLSLVAEKHHLNHYNTEQDVTLAVIFSPSSLMQVISDDM